MLTSDTGDMSASRVYNQIRDMQFWTLPLWLTITQILRGDLQISKISDGRVVRTCPKSMRSFTCHYDMFKEKQRHSGGKRKVHKEISSGIAFAFCESIFQFFCSPAGRRRAALNAKLIFFLLKASNWLGKYKFGACI